MRAVSFVAVVGVSVSVAASTGVYQLMYHDSRQPFDRVLLAATTERPVLIWERRTIKAVLAGQAASDGKREFTISGCLLRSGYAGYQIDDAKIDAIDGKAVTASSADAGAAIPKKWTLEGGGNLGPRVGEKVQVLGRSDWQDSPASKNADEPPAKNPTLEVKSVKTLASSCT